MTEKPKLVRVLAADPGVTGAIAIGDICPETFRVFNATVIDMPVSSCCDVWSDENQRVAPDEVAILEFARSVSPQMAIVEHQSPRPKTGKNMGGSATSEWRLALGYGALRSALRIHFLEKGDGPAVFAIRPHDWKKVYDLGKDKEVSRALAIEAFPECAASLSRKKDHGRAEALLILKFFATNVMPKGADGVTVF